MKLAIDRVVKNWRSASEFAPTVKAFQTNAAGSGRRFVPHTESPLAEGAFRAFGLRIDAPEPINGHMICNNYAEGSFVHEHADSAPPGFAHVRCNWMIKKPRRVAIRSSTAKWCQWPRAIFGFALQASSAMRRRQSQAVSA